MGEFFEKYAKNITVKKWVISPESGVIPTSVYNGERNVTIPGSSTDNFVVDLVLDNPKNLSYTVTAELADGKDSGVFPSHLEIGPVDTCTARMTIFTPKGGQNCRLRLRFYDTGTDREYAPYDFPVIHVLGTGADDGNGTGSNDDGTFTLKYDAAGGSGAPASVTVADKTVPIAVDDGAGMTPPHNNSEYTFLGWIMVKDTDGRYDMTSLGTPAEWTAGSGWFKSTSSRSRITLTGNTTLYAIWGINIQSGADFAKIGLGGSSAANTAAPWTDDAYYAVTRNISGIAAPAGYTGTGSDAAAASFKGVLDGDPDGDGSGFAAIDMALTFGVNDTTLSPAAYTSGLFARIDGGTVRSLKLTGTQTFSTAAAPQHVGAVTGYMTAGSISAIVSTAAVRPAGTVHSNVGGIAGTASGGTITACAVHGEVKAGAGTGVTHRVGGIAGVTGKTAVITNSAVTALVQSASTGDYTVGGIAGYHDGIIRYCYMAGNINVDSPSVRDNYNTIDSRCGAGGIAGSCDRTTGTTAEITNSVMLGAAIDTNQHWTLRTGYIDGDGYGSASANVDTTTNYSLMSSLANGVIFQSQLGNPDYGGTTGKDGQKMGLTIIIGDNAQAGFWQSNVYIDNGPDWTGNWGSTAAAPWAWETGTSKAGGQSHPSAAVGMPRLWFDDTGSVDAWLGRQVMGLRLDRCFYDNNPLIESVYASGWIKPAAPGQMYLHFIHNNGSVVENGTLTENNYVGTSPPFVDVDVIRAEIWDQRDDDGNQTVLIVSNDITIPTPAGDAGPPPRPLLGP